MKPKSTKPPMLKRIWGSLFQKNTFNTSTKLKRKVREIQKSGYSGTAILTKVKPIAVHEDLGIEKHDKEGRTITA